MTEFLLSVGDVMVFDTPTIFKCHGLGSCVGLFVYDKAKGISGGANILLSDEEEIGTGFSEKRYDTGRAIRKILEEFKKKGSTLSGLQAKITGGANILNSSIEYGSNTVESLKNHLLLHKIQIIATDVGGKSFRNVRFNSISEAMFVQLNERNFCDMY